MDGQLVFVPCRPARWDARSALIDDAGGWPRKVVGPLGVWLLALPANVFGYNSDAACSACEASLRARLWSTLQSGRRTGAVFAHAGAVSVARETPAPSAAIGVY